MNNLVEGHSCKILLVDCLISWLLCSIKQGCARRRSSVFLAPEIAHEAAESWLGKGEVECTHKELIGRKLVY